MFRSTGAAYRLSTCHTFLPAALTMRLPVTTNLALYLSSGSISLSLMPMRSFAPTTSEGALRTLTPTPGQRPSSRRRSQS